VTLRRNQRNGESVSAASAGGARRPLMRMHASAFNWAGFRHRDMYRPRAWSRRAVVAAAVALLHVVVVQVLVLSAEVRGRPTPNDALQVMLIAPDETRRPEPLPEPSPPEAAPVSAVAPSVSAEDASSPAASFMAVTVPRLGEARAESDALVPVVEAMDFDSDILRERCIRAYPDTAPDLEVDGTLTLLVRVEPSGRPSETKIVVSSGVSQLDEAVAACFLSLGAFEPVSVNGQAVGSWQRVIWHRRMAR